ncbi:hypothetical protein TVAG_491310 [Trichomonas vaginalis G3]|uniref:Dynein regulatory complex protein 10 n=1 Tax=Trichomonas vaginalis (strain ATCC PRA-98 / G3) TaxID=412133 RepID=A2E073_TRIV3|nr:IQ domain-containing protein D family [Trichomonas vaginalis G3]EAY13992.1 hypothetical protein TVAG_491310 [Trichomonas vaginalis G3]KAI5551817.1 IQ domain-containing protein D family [Trichomonas vaginalis G3]|eukprot:XP_001326215.1 hypothetical protein [Trichomonas vaginalis G3]
MSTAPPSLPKNSNTTGGQSINNRVSSVEARRILAVLEDTASRMEYAVILPTLNDFLEGRDNVPEDVEIAHNDFLNHQRALMSAMTNEGKPKPGSQQDFEEEGNLYRETSRDLIRAMRNHADYFAPLLAQTSSYGGSTAKLTAMMKDLNSMELLTFSTPVESDEKQKRLIQDISGRKKANRELIEQLNARDAKATHDKEQQVHDRDEQYELIKQQLTQAKATESSLMQDDIVQEEVQTQEESLKTQLNNTREDVSKTQKKNSEEEGKQRRALRKDEEAVQALIKKYDQEMTSLVKQNEEAVEAAEKIEKELHDLQAEAAQIEKIRAPMVNDEHVQSANQLKANKLSQDMIAASVKLQMEIRKFLKTAPKFSKKKGKKGKGGKKGKK